MLQIILYLPRQPNSVSVIIFRLPVVPHDVPVTLDFRHPRTRRQRHCQRAAETGLLHDSMDIRIPLHDHPLRETVTIPVATREQGHMRTYGLNKFPG